MAPVFARSEPHETVWNFMKGRIQERYEDNLHAYDELRAAILAAWKAVEGAFLMELLESMPARCQAVIDTNTRYSFHDHLPHQTAWRIIYVPQH